MMSDVEVGRFTVGVFQDLAWAERGVEALRGQGLAVEALSALGGDAGAGGVHRARARRASTLEIHGIGPVRARGPLFAALPGSDQGLANHGIAATMRRVGFQAHDGRIFEKLTARGGVLVSIHSEPRAADALAVLHSYGGGNAAIGAWTGRV